MRKIKIAIHKRPGSFSDRWIPYCKENSIPYKIVNCYDSDIVQQLEDCNGLMWHWSQSDYKAQNFARQLILSIEKMGLKVFPNSENCWHFDDKVGQKYLLESINAPLVPSHVFYDKQIAKDWVNSTAYPKVFKLRGGAGSLNVKLVKNKTKAHKLINKAFRKGFSPYNRFDGFKERWWALKRDKNMHAVLHLIKGVARLFFPKERYDLLPKQKGYIYFQDFIPNNNFDDRVVVIGNRAIAIRRYVRKNDFRASGSGVFTHKLENFNLEVINIAFEIAKKTNSNSLALDFIYDDDKPYVVEISYAYAMGLFYDNCPGFWDEQLNWYEEKVNPQKYIIEDFIKSLEGNEDNS